MSGPDLLKDYIEFINEPKHLINPIREARLMNNDFLEANTKTEWYMIPLFFTPQVIYMLYATYMCQEATLLMTVAMFALGVIETSFFEYWIHRFIFHGEDYWLINDSRLIAFHFLIHGIHHAFPQDRRRLVLPPTLGMVFLFVLGVYPAFYIYGLPTHLALPLIAGNYMGYVKYDCIHYFFHHSSPTFSYIKELKAHHMAHHYRNGQVGFGVSTKFWDVVFRT